MSQPVHSEFIISSVWMAVQALLKQGLGNAVDIDSIGERDFDEEGMLTLRPPSARVLFIEADFRELENQGQNYTCDAEFAVLCADEYRGPDPQEQRNLSLRLAAKISTVLTGARLLLNDGAQSEPLLITGIKPIPTADVGMAYVVGFKVSGTAQFPAPNANPVPPGASNG